MKLLIVKNTKHKKTKKLQKFIQT